MKLKRPAEHLRPRVAHVLESLHFGGVETMMQLISENSSSSDFDHVFFVLGRGGNVAEKLKSRGESVFVLGQPTRIPSPKAVVSLTLALRNARPDLLHSHGAEANFHGAIAASFLGLLIICEEIGLPEHSRWARTLFRRVYRRASRVIAVSESTKSALIAMKEGMQEQVRVLPLPARLSDYKPRKIPKREAATLAFVGRLEPIKNVGGLVEAVSLLRDTGVQIRLMVFGEGSLRGKIQEQVHRLRLGSQVSLFGFVDSPIDHMDEAQFFVQPSFSEGLGSLAAVEAMSAGIPPLITDIGGASEIVENGVTGWLLADVGPEALADKIREVIALPIDELNRVGRAANIVASQRFCPEKYVRALDAEYKEILGIS